MLAASPLLMVVVLSACGSSVANFEIQDRNTGAVTDRVAVLNSAEHPMTPGVAIAGRIDAHGQFVPIDMAAAGSPVEQLMPIATATIGALGAIEAANQMPGTNVVAEGGDAASLASNVNWTNVQQQVTAAQWTNIVNCNQPISIGGHLRHHPDC